MQEQQKGVELGCVGRALAMHSTQILRGGTHRQLCGWPLVGTTSTREHMQMHPAGYTTSYPEKPIHMLSDMLPV